MIEVAVVSDTCVKHANVTNSLKSRFNHLYSYKTPKLTHTVVVRFATTGLQISGDFVSDELPFQGPYSTVHYFTVSYSTRLLYFA